MTTQTIQLYNLPPQPTPFVGREPEITEIVGLLHDPDCRLLSLVGPGGIGKTRLAVESILGLSSDDYEHGIFYVPLSQLTSADNIVSTIIGVLGIYIAEEGTPQEELLTFLSRRNLLLVMDNFEHVSEGANIVADILNVAPDVKVLVTSRESLNLRMERVWHVRGMRFPDTDQLDDIDTFSALKLFVDRATWVRREFSVEVELACAIQICQLVDGMPLALELAASWIKVLTCAEIIAEIQRNVDFLASNVRNIPERHRSIRAVFDHSWHLCDETEQTVFRRLCVFRGGFTREAAETIVGASLLTLSNLVDKSILQKLPSGRYKLHRLSRQFADEKLELAGETNALHDAHMRYFADFMQEHAIDIKGRRQLEGLDEVEAEFFNNNKAWDRAVAQADYGVLDQMMEGLALYCDMRARFVVGENLFAETLSQLSPEALDLPIYNRLRVRYLQVWTLQERRPVPNKIFQMNAECMSIANLADDEMTLMLCRWLQGELYRIENNVAEALPILKSLNELPILTREPYYHSRCLRSIEHLFIIDLITDRQYEIEISHLHQESTHQESNLNGFAHAMGYVAFRNLKLGNLDDTQKYLKQAIFNWTLSKDRKSLGVTSLIDALVSLIKGDFADAHRQLIDSLQMQTQMNYLGNQTAIHTFLSIMTTIQGDLTMSKELLEKAYSFHHLNPYRGEWENIASALLDIANHHYPSARKPLSKAFQTTQIPAIVCSITTVAFVFHHDGDDLLAIELLGLLQGQFPHLMGWAKHWTLLSKLQRDLEAELGTEAYQAAWDRGANRNLDTTMAELIAYFGADEPDTAVPIAQPLVEPLTERELEVLELVAQGLTNPQIADKLYLSTGTVKVHTRNIYGKLNVSNRTEAATTARQLNLIG